MRTCTLTLAGCATLLACGALAQPPGGGPFPGGPPGGPFPGGPPGGAFDPARNAVVRALDTDGDGGLSADELAVAAQTLKKLDKNADGKLGRDEMRGQMGGRGAPGGFGGRPGRGPQFEGQAAGLSATTLAQDAVEQKALDALAEMERTQGRMMNVPASDGRMLRLLVESLGAKSVVEIGTSNGVSAIWMALALKKTGGKLTTHEIDTEHAALARQNFSAAGLSELITVVEGDAHQTVAKLKGPVDLVFIDADKEGYADYLQKLLPLVRPGGLITAHNISARMADPGFLKAITTDASLETVFYTAGGGLSVTLKKR